MPDFTHPPTPTDLVSLFAQAGLDSLIASFDQQTALDTALEQWESETEFRPFQSSGTDTTRIFTAPGPSPRSYRSLITGFPFGGGPGVPEGPVGGGCLLPLGGGVLSVSSLTVDWGEGPQGYTAGLDYFLETDTAAPDGWPCTMIRFARPLYSLRQGIAITGKWGFCSAWPAGAFEAVTLAAGIKLLPNVAAGRRITAEANQQTAETVRQSGPVRVEFAVQTPAQTTDLSDLLCNWAAQYTRVLRKYRLVDT